MGYETILHRIQARMNVQILFRIFGEMITDDEGMKGQYLVL